MRHYWLMSAILGLSFIQCSSTETKPPKYPDAASFCTGVATAECSDKVMKACLATDKPTCVSNLTTICVQEYVTPYAGLTYDSGQAENCVNVINGVYSNGTTITAAQYASIAAACGAVYSGNGTTGSPCAHDTDCKQSSGLHCVIHVGSQAPGDAGEMEGTCQVPVTAQAGGSCSPPDAQCATGYHCGSTSHCDQDEVLNASCSDNDPCAS